MGNNLYIYCENNPVIMVDYNGSDGYLNGFLNLITTIPDPTVQTLEKAEPYAIIGIMTVLEFCAPESDGEDQDVIAAEGEVIDGEESQIEEDSNIVSNIISFFNKSDDTAEGAGKAESLTNEQLANKVANKYGGTVEIADNGKGYVVKTNNITTRIMDSGGGRTNYYKISNQGKGTIDRFGNYTSDLSKNHIDIGPNSYDEITNIIDKFIKR